METCFLTQFRHLVDQKCLRDAVCLASSFAREFPHVGLYHESLGYALWMLDEFEDAKASLTRARLCGEISSSGLVLLFRMALQAGNRKQCREILNELLNDHGLAQGQLEGLASKLGGMQEYSAALQVCQHLALVYPNSPDAWYGIGFYQERLGCPPQVCIKAFRQAAELSGCVCSRVHLAKVLAQMERWDEAYALVRFIPLTHLNRANWAHTVFQIAMANQDLALAEEILAKCSFQASPCSRYLSSK